MARLTGIGHLRQQEGEKRRLKRMRRYRRASTRASTAEKTLDGLLTAAALHAVRFAAGSVVRPLGSARICVEVIRTDDGLLRQIGYEDIREDKPAREIVRP